MNDSTRFLRLLSAPVEKSFYQCVELSNGRQSPRLPPPSGSPFPPLFSSLFPTYYQDQPPHTPKHTTKAPLLVCFGDPRRSLFSHFPPLYLSLAREHNRVRRVFFFVYFFRDPPPNLSRPLSFPSKPGLPKNPFSSPWASHPNLQPSPIPFPPTVLSLTGRLQRLVRSGRPLLCLVTYVHTP